MKRVFISYRRRDTAREAHVLKTILETRLRDTAVFLDTDDIAPGQQWRERLEHEVARSAAVIVLIGPDWRGGPKSADLLLQENDWVRREIEIALQSKPGVLLPVLVEGATVQLQDLPPSVRALSDLQAAAVTSDDWVDDVGQIVSWTSRAINAEQQSFADVYPEPSQIKSVFPALSLAEIERMLESGGVEGWIVRSTVVPGEEVDGGHELYKLFEFSNFRRAFNFMQLVATKADQFNHHPDWRNTWNRVYVSQRTWDAGHVITAFDLQIAAYMNQAAAKCSDESKPKWPPTNPTKG
jgi:pterin-4a-carbinolamine dehydratase